jgi:hypothetical protein
MTAAVSVTSCADTQDLVAGFPHLSKLPLPQKEKGGATTIPALPPQLVHETLPGGLQTFVLRNREPRDRAEVWLALKAGSVMEAEDQRGVAHFCEHLAFSATEKFTNH